MKNSFQWKRWNLGYTKEVMDRDPDSPLTQALLSCWPPRIQRALVARFKSRAQEFVPDRPDQTPRKRGGQAAPPSNTLPWEGGTVPSSSFPNPSTSPWQWVTMRADSPVPRESVIDDQCRKCS